MKNTPSTEERIWAVIAHLSAIAMGMGLLLPVIGWSEQRRKSKYAAFQCLQALGYQSLGFAIWLLASLVLMIVLFLIISFGTNGLSDNGVLTIVFRGLLGLLILLAGVYLLLPIIGAILCGLGREFSYPFLGVRLARYVGYSSLDDGTQLIEEYEDRWVSAMCHLSAINVFWGMFAPLVAWILQGRRSIFLKFQALQTFVFQAGAFVFLMVAIVLILGGTVLFAISMSFTPEGFEFLIAPSLIVGFIVYIVTQFCASAFLLLVPLLHIFGQWAGYRVLKGDDYRYPLAGKWVERWLAKRANTNSKESTA